MVSNALEAADGVAAGAANAIALTQRQVEPVVQQAIVNWNQSGLPRELLSALAHPTVQIADLSGSLLGLTAGGVVAIDSTAAGHIWFTEPYFGAAPPAGQMDLLTVVTHELGHLLGLGDTTSPGIMQGTLPPGVRIIPESNSLAVGQVAASEGLWSGLTPVFVSFAAPAADPDPALSPFAALAVKGPALRAVVVSTRALTTSEDLWASYLGSQMGNLMAAVTSPSAEEGNAQSVEEGNIQPAPSASLMLPAVHLAGDPPAQYSLGRAAAADNGPARAATLDEFFARSSAELADWNFDLAFSGLTAVVRVKDAT